MNPDQTAPWSSLILDHMVCNIGHITGWVVTCFFWKNVLLLFHNDVLSESK